MGDGAALACGMNFVGSDEKVVRHSPPVAIVVAVARALPLAQAWTQIRASIQAPAPALALAVSG